MGQLVALHALGNVIITTSSVRIVALVVALVVGMVCQPRFGVPAG